MNNVISSNKKKSFKKTLFHRSIRGQTAVFLCIILLGVTALAGVLTDISRISTGRTYVRRAASAAAKSVLAGYSSRLYNSYGIFAYNAGDMPKLEKTVRQYMERNLSAGNQAQGFDLYGFKIENIKVSPIFNLTENEASRKQILEYMRFRAPKELVEGIVERLDAVRQSGRMAGVYKRKVTVDKLLGRVGKIQEALKRNISGTIGDGRSEKYFICGLDAEDLGETLKSVLLSDAGEYRSISEKISDLYRLLNEINTSKGDKQKKAKVKKIKKEISNLEKSLSEVKSRMNDTLSLSADTADRYLKPNREARDNIGKIIKYAGKVNDALKLLDEYMGQPGTGQSALSGDFDCTIDSDIKKVKELMLNGERAQELISAVEGNIRSLENTRKAAETVIEQVNSGNISYSVIFEAAGNIKNSLAGYIPGVSYDYKTVEKDTDGQDMRKETAAQAKSLIDLLPGEDISFAKAGIDPSQLPSHLKHFTEKTESVESATAGSKSANDNTSGVTDDEIDLVDEESTFAENSFGFLEKVGSMISGKLASIRDEVYINEYIMGMFKSSVTKIKKGSGNESLLDLRGGEIGTRDTFFNSEVEYILNGNSSEKINKTITKSEILLIRFGLNTLHVYSDTGKKALSEGIAAAVSGWWSAGAAVPVVSNLIRCGWGLGEAILDVNDLMQGESVPLYKLKGDWRLDIGLPGKNGPKSDPRLAFSYNDYLRLFLLLEDSNTKMDRIEDLVQLNIQKTDPSLKMSNFNTYIRIEAEVSMKYLFVTGSFMPKSLKTKDGRHVFRLVVYEGY